MQDCLTSPKTSRPRDGGQRSDINRVCIHRIQSLVAFIFFMVHSWIHAFACVRENCPNSPSQSSHSMSAPDRVAVCNRICIRIPIEPKCKGRKRSERKGSDRKGKEIKGHLQVAELSPWQPLFFLRQKTRQHSTQ